MRMLLDSHAVLWFILDDPRLSDRARECIVATDSSIYVSPATLWEIAIKIRLGKYQLPEPYESFVDAQLEQNGFEILPILPRHTAVLTSLPFHHRDPFDRLIVAQALRESLPLLSIDTGLDAYGVTRIW